MPVYGGLLVGGASRRMGRPKALVEVDGVTLAERAAAALAPHVDRLVLLGAGPVPESLAGLQRLADADLPGAGSLSATQAAAPAATQTGSPAGGLVGDLVDQPAGPLAGLLAALRHSAETAGEGARNLAGRITGQTAGNRAEDRAGDGAGDGAEDRTWVLCSCDLPRVTPEAVAWLLAERRPERLAVLPRLAPGAPPEPLFALYEAAALPLVEALVARGVRAPWRLAGEPGVALVTVPSHLAPCWRDADTPEELPGTDGGGGNRRGAGTVETR